LLPQHLLDFRNVLLLLDVSHLSPLIIVGSADRVTLPEDCRALFDKATPPKECSLIEGVDHLFSEHRIRL
jgi:hypothetical protein